MRKLMLFSVMLGLMSVGFVEASLSMQYDATVLPDDSGSIVYGDGSTGSFVRSYSPTTAEILSPDIFHLSTIDPGSGTCWYSRYVGGSNYLQLNSDDGYFVEMRAKLNYTDEQGASSAALLDADDGRELAGGVAAYWSLALYTDTDGKNKYQFAGDYPHRIYGEIGTDFHTFKVIVGPDGAGWYNATLYVDGSLAGSVPLEDYSAYDHNQLRFGDFTGAPDADWQIDYIYANDVPEPATIGLIMLGMLGFISRKKK